MMNSVEVVRDLLEALLKSHKHSQELRRQLASRELDRRLAVITPAVFDPNGVVRAAIKARDFLESVEEIETFVSFTDCKNPDCPVGCPDSHCLPMDGDGGAA